MQTDVPEGWERKPLGTVATIVGGTGFPTKHQGQTGAEFPFIKVSDMNLAGNERTVTWSTNSVTQDTLKLLGATAHPVGTTIFPKVGAALLTNKRRLLGVPATFDNNVMGVIARHADSDFVFHWTCTLDFANHVQLGALPSINQATVSSLPILLPPLPEQRKIAAILSSVDEAIQATQAVIEQTRRVKEGLLQDLLTKGIGHTRFKQLVTIQQEVLPQDRPLDGPADGNQVSQPSLEEMFICQTADARRSIRGVETSQLDRIKFLPDQACRGGRPLDLGNQSDADSGPQRFDKSPRTRSISQLPL